MSYPRAASADLESIRTDLLDLADRQGWIDVRQLCDDLAPHPDRRIVIAHPPDVDSEPLRRWTGPHAATVGLEPVRSVGTRLASADTAIIVLRAGELVPVEVSELAEMLRTARRRLILVLLVATTTGSAEIARQEANIALMAAADPTARHPGFDGSTQRFALWCTDPSTELADRVARDKAALRGWLDEQDADVDDITGALLFAVGLAETASADQPRPPARDLAVDLLEGLPAQRTRLLSVIDSELANLRGSGGGSCHALVEQMGRVVETGQDGAVPVQRWVTGTAAPMRERVLLARDQAATAVEKLAVVTASDHSVVRDLVDQIRRLDLPPPTTRAEPIVPIDVDRRPPRWRRYLPPVLTVAGAALGGGLLPLPVVGAAVGGTAGWVAGSALSGESGEGGLSPASPERIAAARAQTAGFVAEWTRQLSQLGTDATAAFDAAFAAVTAPLHTPDAADPPPTNELDSLRDRLVRRTTRPHLEEGLT